MPPYRNFVPMKSHGIAVEDAREAEATDYFRQVAEEAARERAVSQARGDRSILARIRRWWSPDKIDPNLPHEFRAIDSVAAMGAGEQSGPLQGNTQAAVLAVSADAMRGACRLPGCGRAADDPIHQ